MVKHKQQLISVAIIFGLILTACQTSELSIKQTSIAITPTYLALPTGSIQPNSTAMIGINQEATFRLITHVSTTYGQFGGRILTTESEEAIRSSTYRNYLLLQYNPVDRISIAVAFPKEFRLGQQNISFPLDNDLMTITDTASPAARLRLITQPTEEASISDPESVLCDRFIVGQITVFSTNPLRGNFQFNCQFSDGQAAAVSGIFSQ